MDERRDFAPLGLHNRGLTQFASVGCRAARWGCVKWRAQCTRSHRGSGVSPCGCMWGQLWQEIRVGLSDRAR
eukprot:1900675-Amphidinium_carterae.3